LPPYDLIALLTVWQALVVSHELIRVAILWHELWHEGLEEASRLYFTEKNPEGMIAALEPLHDMLEAVCFFWLLL
jgi:serine/threonine-protein kinase mTOR